MTETEIMASLCKCHLSSPYSSSSSMPRCAVGFPYLNSKVIHCMRFPLCSSAFSGARVPNIPHSVSLKELICRAAEYKFPDPIPEFADAETEKFRAHLIKKLSKKDIYGDSVDEVVGICTEIFSTFLHSEYGGPGTLLVIPFIDMADTVDERGLPGGPQAARAAVKWAQDHVDKDWKEWTGDGH